VNIPLLVVAEATSLHPGAVLTSWSLEPLPTIGIVVAGILYVEGLRTVRRRGGPPFTAWRVGCFAAGLVVLFLALASPIDAYAPLLLSDHMLQHVLITMVAAPLLVLGTPILLALRAAAPATRRRVLLPVLHAAPVRALASPIVGWAAFAVVMWGTHVPAVYEAAVRSTGLHALEHLAYLGAALLFWRPVVGLEPGPGRLSHPARILFLFLAMPVTSLLGLAISASNHVLYPSYVASAHVLGVSALSDQKTAGTMMWTTGMFLMAPALGLVLLDWMRRDEQQARRADARRAGQSSS
jgi:putative membrane protein/putative copper resistance protein D